VALPAPSGLDVPNAASGQAAQPVRQHGRGSGKTNDKGQSATVRVRELNRLQQSAQSLAEPFAVMNGKLSKQAVGIVDALSLLIFSTR